MNMTKAESALRVYNFRNRKGRISTTEFRETDQSLKTFNPRQQTSRKTREIHETKTNPKYFTCAKPRIKESVRNNFFYL